MSDKPTLIHQGKLISLFREPVPLREGGQTTFDIVKHPGGAVIAALNEANELCLLKQRRHAVDQTIWELPAGCLEINEDPLTTAQRELEEEAGVIARTWQSLGRLVTSPGFSNETLYLFKATDLSAGRSNLDAAETIDVYWIPLTQAIAMAHTGEIEDAKTLSVLLKLSSQ